MKELDLTNVDPSQRLEKIVAEFEALPDEENLTLVANETLLSVLTQFQKQFWTRYDWNPLEAGPDRWKSVLRKRSGKKAGSEDIRSFMSQNHSYCDNLYAAAEAALLDGETATGRELMASFILAMDRHFEMEEQLFFPAFEDRTGMHGGGPTMVMRMEHDQMRKVLGQIKNALAVKDSDTALAAGETLLILMQQHNMKEEGMLYPMGDRHISDVSEDLLKKMQLLRA